MRLRQPSTELLRLRGEVGELKRQLVVHRRPPLSARSPAPPTPEAGDNPEKEAAKAFGIRRMIEAKHLVVGFHEFAAEHDGRFPDSIDDVLARLKSGTAESEQKEAVQRLQPEDFELLFRGSLKEIANPPAAIVLRERQAWQSPDGRWVRTYGFADGHSEIKAMEDGDFSGWEAQHQAQPK